MHTGEQRIVGSRALGEESAEYSGQYVAHPGRRHARVSRCIDAPGALGKSTHAAATLDDDTGLELGCDLLCRGDAIALYPVGFN